VPAEVGDYTDFYASVHHATNVGAMFRPDRAAAAELQVGADRLPRRASSSVPSGRRCAAIGQRGARRRAPDFGPTRALDYELELGVYVGPATRSAAASRSTRRSAPVRRRAA
jgi:fumarylacetoacetase